MDLTFDHDMDITMPAIFDYDSTLEPTLVSTLDELLAAAPQQAFTDPAPVYDFRHDTPAGCDMFIPDASVYEHYHRQFPVSITLESSTHADQYGNIPCIAPHQQDEVMPHDPVKEEQTHETLSDWKSLINFDIPDYTQVAITDIPQIQTLYNAYLATYDNSNATNSTRMHYAKALSFALLTHYYPASQGYTIAPTSPGPIAKTGLSFILAADDNSDIWKDLPAKKSTTRKRPLSQKELQTADAKDRAAKYFHGANWAGNLQWDWIKPENITSFVVVRNLMVIDKETGVWGWGWKPHTYMSILVDDFGAEPPKLSRENITCRSDVLADALCRRGKIQEGYGILLYGPRLEFYDFDAGAEWVWHQDEEDGETQDVEPRCEVLEIGGAGMQMDLRDVDLYGLNGAFSTVARREVVYRENNEDEVKLESDAVGL
jgi:hypothetical protein